MTQMNLVTGGSGMLGGAVADELRRRGLQVRAISSKDADLRDYDSTLALFRETRPEIVYHAAARVHGIMGNATFPGEMFAENVRINLNVIDAAREVGVKKFVAISTVATYSANAVMPVTPDAIWDGPPHAAEAAYGHAKRAMLAQLEAYHAQYGMNFAYAIMTNIYGPNDRFDAKYGHVVPSLVSKFFASARSGNPVQIWGTGRAERDFIFSEDAAAALALVGEKFKGPLNIATGQIESIRRLVENLQKISGVTDVEWDETKPDGQLLRRYDVQPLFDLGFRPANTLRSGLEKTYNWYASNSEHARH